MGGPLKRPLPGSTPRRSLASSKGDEHVVLHPQLQPAAAAAPRTPGAAHRPPAARGAGSLPAGPRTLSRPSAAPQQDAMYSGNYALAGLDDDESNSNQEARPQAGVFKTVSSEAPQRRRRRRREADGRPGVPQVPSSQAAAHIAPGAGSSGGGGTAAGQQPYSGQYEPPGGSEDSSEAGRRQGDAGAGRQAKVRDLPAGQELCRFRGYQPASRAHACHECACRLALSTLPRLAPLINVAEPLQGAGWQRAGS